MLEAQRAAFFADLPVSTGVRRDRLRRAVSMIAENGDALCGAAIADMARQDIESVRATELTPALAALHDAIAGVGRWTQPQNGRGPIARLITGDDYLEYLPMGVVGIAAPVSLPLLWTVTLLAGALAAGNRAMLSFGSGSLRLGETFQDLLPRYFDPLEVDVAASDAFDDLAFDLRTGGHPDGGDNSEAPRWGQSPVIVGRSADFAKAGDTMIARKRGGEGCSPLAPDYLLVPEEQEEALAAWLWRAAMQPGVKGADLTEAERERVARLLDDARARGGEVMTAQPRDAATPLHIVRHATDDMLMMQEGGGGSILPLCNYARIEDAIAAINGHLPPLAIYYFGRDPAERRHVLEHTLSAAIAIDRGIVPAGDRGDGMTLNIEQGEAGFRRFSRMRRVYRPPLFGFARRATGEGDEARGAVAAALR